MLSEQEENFLGQLTDNHELIAAIAIIRRLQAKLEQAQAEYNRSIKRHLADRDEQLKQIEQAQRERDALREACEQAKTTLLVGAAEYVPAIPDAVEILQKTLAALDDKHGK
jgi:outer membrane protein TolC